MKTLLVVLLTGAFSLGLTAQRSLPADLVPMKSRTFPGLSATKSVADTIAPGFVRDTCYTNPGKGLTAYFDNSDSFEGFFTGSNTFSDFEHLQRLTYDGAETFMVTEVITALFESNAASINDGYLLAVVYDELDAQGNLNAALGVSDTLRLEDVSFDDFVSFTFSDPVEVSNDSFFIGIDFRGVYEDIADTKEVLLYSGGWSEILSDDTLKSDRIHANAAGYRQFAEGLHDYLQEEGVAP